MDTTELINKCINRDNKAWNEFVSRYHRLVFISIKHKLKKLNVHLSYTVIDDIAQEIFISIWEKNTLKTLTDINALKGWLSVISINSTVNHLKKNRYFKNDIFLPIDEHGSLTDVHISEKRAVLPDTRTINDNTERKEYIENIDIAVSKLSTKQQLAVKLFLYHGKKQKDIAKLMKIPERTVATLVRRAKERLKNELGGLFDYVFGKNGTDRRKKF